MIGIGIIYCKKRYRYDDINIESLKHEISKILTKYLYGTECRNSGFTFS